MVEVAVDQPVDKTFSYLLPAHLAGKVLVGMRALVPFGRRRVTGYILKINVDTKIEKLKELDACLDKDPVFNPTMLDFFLWIASYYLVPVGEVIKTALPPGINSSSRRFARVTEKGRQCGNEIKGTEAELLSFIDGKGETSLSSVERRFGSKGELSKLCRLVESGLIEIETKIQGGRVKVRTERFVRLAFRQATSSVGVSKRWLEIVNYLEEKHEVPLATLLRELRTTRTTLNGLNEAGIIEYIDKEVYRDPFCLPIRESAPAVLNSDQQTVMSDIEDALKKGGYAPFLLEGKTGSGKTEIYLRAIERVGGKAIVLIPEISLTPQITARFRERFGDRVAVLHSRLSEGERYDQWRRIKEGLLDIVVGARSAVFAPVDDVRIIIVDEEHEASYKQEDGIRYNARDLALVRGKMEDSLVILGSATPSLESVHNARSGKIGHLMLPERVQKRPLPSIDIVDMRKEAKNTWLSAALQALLKENLDRGEQSLLFLNRRGFAPFVLCGDCGHTFRCPHCSVTLTWHQGAGVLRCHYCDYKLPALPLCPECGGGDVKGLGFGTEKLEELLRESLGDARIARLDRDTVKKKGDLESILNSFEKGEVDILLGTQMIAKGHHFPGVTLAGVLMADLSLNLPDFRAAERTYQILTQVAGRAGRGDSPGRVVIQTFNPEHYSILPGGEKDGQRFYERELAMREEYSYPPFSRLVNFKVDGNEEKEVTICIKRIKEFGKEVLRENVALRIEILGPAPAPISRIKGKFRWHLLAKCEDAACLHKFVKKVILKMKSGGGTPSSVRVVTDFDPYNLL